MLHFIDDLGYIHTHAVHDSSGCPRRYFLLIQDHCITLSADPCPICGLSDSQATSCKRLMKYQEGIALISTNSAYDPMLFSNAEIEEKPVRILGKVVELRAKF